MTNHEHIDEMCRSIREQNKALKAKIADIDRRIVFHRMAFELITTGRGAELDGCAPPNLANNLTPKI